MTVSFCERQCVRENLLEIVFDLKACSALPVRESRRIENDCVEFFTFARQPWENVPDIIRDEAVIDR